MRNTIVKRLAAVVTISAVLVAVPGAAFGQTEPVERSIAEADRSQTIDQLKRRALEAIDKRLDAIARWTETVEANDHLDADHRARLLADLSATSRGLDSLADDIEAATTYSELGRLIPKIVEDYWVFALLGPKVHLVIAADTMADINDRFEDAAASIQEAIDRLDEAGYDPAAAQVALDRMQAHLVAASTLIGPIPGAVLSLRPADMPEASAELRNARADLESAADELRAARKAGHEAVKAIKDAING